MQKERFSVWVGGGEVNENLMTYEDAVDVAEEWLDKGYDDVLIDEYIDGKDEGGHRFLKIVEY